MVPLLMVPLLRPPEPAHVAALARPLSLRPANEYGETNALSSQPSVFMYVWDPSPQQFSHENLDSIQILFHCHLESDKRSLIMVNSSHHNSKAVVACAKFCSNITGEIAENTAECH